MVTCGNLALHETWFYWLRLVGSMFMTTSAFQNVSALKIRPSVENMQAVK
jgi:hypothetical protein